MLGNNDFEIVNDVLRKYKGNDQDVVIPDGVTTIGWEAFARCNCLRSVTVPASVVRFDSGAFRNCKSLEIVNCANKAMTLGGNVFEGCDLLRDENGYIIFEGILDDYSGQEEDITVPDNIRIIGESAFSNNKALLSVHIPKTVSRVCRHAFSHCKNLKTVTIDNEEIELEAEAFSIGAATSGIEDLRIGNYPLQVNNFGKLGVLPKKSIPLAAKLYKNLLSASDLSSCILKKNVWKQLDPSVQAEIYLYLWSDKSNDQLTSCIGSAHAENVCTELLRYLTENEAVKGTAIQAMSSFLLTHFQSLSDEALKKAYDWIVNHDTEGKSLKEIQNNYALMDRVTADEQENKTVNEAEQIVLDLIDDNEDPNQSMEKRIYMYCGLKISELPELLGKDGSRLNPLVLAWLLTAHDTVDPASKTANKPLYNEPGFDEKAKKVLVLIDDQSFKAALRILADNCLGISGYSRKMFAAYPICRYADEEMMNDLTKRAPKWKSGVSGNDAPPLRTFRMACAYSNTTAAMYFADKYNDLNHYAELRGMTAEEFRDTVLSDVGLDEDGNKTYDLGNQIVKVHMLNDLSFEVLIPGNGKLTKSLPKKGADPDLYAEVNNDFTQLKKNVKQILKNRKDTLFTEFLEKTPKKADSWKKSYLKNPVLRKMASLFVWMQAGNTFTIKNGLPVLSDGKSYEIGEDVIFIAHPMEMNHTEIIEWQKYFASNNLKQPFSQIWEPAIDPKQIKSNRYEGVMIPYYRFRGMEKHGIDIEDRYFHDEILISFTDCAASVERIDYRRHEIRNEDNFEIKSIQPIEFTRRANHIFGYLDKVTVSERILKDDIAIQQYLDEFTLEQFSEFINLAAENKCSNVLAVLLDYKEKDFSGFDPMDEFVLEI